MNFLLKHKKKLVVVIILPLLLLTSFLTYQGWRLASPSRKVIQDYHLEWINHSEQHGISIEFTVCLSGKAPVLVIEPALPLGERGIKIRNQLEQRGFSIKPVDKLISPSHTVVLLHGRNGRKEDLLAVAERFCAVGLRCLLIDLPAHGDSALETVKFGADEWERDLPYRALLECSRKFHFSPTDASLWGMSMGGSFANSALADVEHGDHWKSAIIVCSFDQLDKVIRAKCRSELLTSIVSKVSENFGGARLGDVTPAEWVKSVETPVMVVHGNDDSLISRERGRALYNAFASTDKRWIEVDGGTHQNILVTPMPLYSEMLGWILQH